MGKQAVGKTASESDIELEADGRVVWAFPRGAIDSTRSGEKSICDTFAKVTNVVWQMANEADTLLSTNSGGTFGDLPA